MADLLPSSWSDVVSEDVLDDVLHALELVGEAPTGHPTCDAHAAAEAVANHYFRGSNRDGPGWHEAFDRTARHVAQTYADPWELFT